MEFYFVLLFLLIMAFPIYIIVEKIVDIIKLHKKLRNPEKAMLEFLIAIVAFPIVIYYMDRLNLFSNIGLIKNINTNYDWLSFIGTYASTIISAIFLIYVTRVDREDNNENVRRAQRPYLNVEYLTMQEKEFLMINENLKYSENPLQGSEHIFPVIKITNAGESVAILNPNTMYVIIEYDLIKKISRDDIETIHYSKKIEISNFIKRISIPSNTILYVFFNDEDLDVEILIEDIKIIEANIEYKDLFDVNYVDRSICKETIIQVLNDNEIIQ